MNIKSLLATLVISLSLVAPVLAGPLEDADVAYERGDYATALRLLRSLAEQGHAKAQTNLGVMYQLGRGVPSDFAKATAWFRKAAEKGNSIARYNLGMMFYEGNGQPQDLVKAHMWFNLAAAQGNKQGRKLRDTIAKKMTSNQIAEAQRLAREWKPKK